MKGIYRLISAVISGWLSHHNLLPAALTVVLLIVSPGAYPQQEAIASPQQRADHYLNALKFIMWPKAETTLHFVLLGKDEVCAILAKRLPTLSLNRRSLRITVIDNIAEHQAKTDFTAAIQSADAIYFGNSTQELYPTILQQLNNSTLTASGIPQFASNGGMIEIVDQANNSGLEFRINTQVLKASNIMINSQLLKMSRIINTEP